MKNNSYDKKIFRLMFILNRLSSKEAITTPGLAQEFNVTTRTVQRDLELLSQTGFPLFFDNGTYKFTDGFSIRKIRLFTRPGHGDAVALRVKMNITLHTDGFSALVCVPS